jgi:hypothetical protein
LIGGVLRCSALLVAGLGAPALGLHPATRSQEVHPLRNPSSPDPRLATFLAVVDPAGDRWPAEVINDELDQRLSRLGSAIREKRAEAVRDLLHVSFRGTPLDAQVREATPAPPGAELARVRRGGEPSADREAFTRSLLSWAGDLGPLAVVKFKTVSVEIAPPDESESAAPRRARTRVLFDLVGATERHARTARQGWWRIDWTRRDGEWKMTRLGLDSESMGRVRSAFFTDVTAPALGDNESYWRQLRPSIDDFRARLDAASGIDLYGHNGVSVADVDGDGWEDVFVAQPRGLPNRLYLNRGDGRFADVSRAAGVDMLDRTTMGLFGDADNDGAADLFVILQNDPPVLLLNDGRGRFQVSGGARFERKDGLAASNASASLADYDNDGYLDLYLVCYRFVDAPGEEVELALPYPYHDATNGPPNVLFRNRGDGTFEDVTTEAGLQAGNNRFGFASSWGDFDQDGWLDLYVANDFGRNQFYRNLGGGKFREVSGAAGVEDLGAGMSVAWTDYDLDGRDDLYVGNMWSSAGQRLTGQPGYRQEGDQASYARHAKGNSLFRNLGGGRFAEVGREAGGEFGRWAWGSDAFDADNDGDEELYVANGFITNVSEKDL